MLSCPLCQYSCYKSMYLVNIWIQKRWVNQHSKCSRKLKWVAVPPCSFPFPVLQLQLQLSWSPRFNFIYAHTEVQLARMYLLQGFLESWNKLLWFSLTPSFSNMSFSLQCFFFAKKNWTPVCFFDKKGFPAAFQNATPVHIFVAISVQALSLITINLKFWAFIFKTHVLPGSD